jgi:hypothetical protein
MTAKTVTCPKCTARARVTVRGRYKNARDLGVADFHCVAHPGNAAACPHIEGAIKAALAQADEARPPSAPKALAEAV